jgi:urea transporter/murein DD-endopeptidase MepM/ murein hydrolase activator NlpD
MRNVKMKTENPIQLKRVCPYFCTGVLNSYGQVFFSNNRWFSLILLGVSFFDVWAGIAGLAAVLITHLAAYLIGFKTDHIKAGLYGFNSLLVGLGIGIFFQPGLEFYILLFFVSLLTLFVTVSLEGVIGKYGLPYLSIPFLLALWIVTLASRQFTSLEISEKGIFLMNEFFEMGSHSAVQTYTWLNDMGLPESLRMYFRSLGAIFFQYYLLAGILIAVGLLIYSRIAFTLSLLGFFSAYLFYLFIGANLAELNTAYIGFNFILTAIAIGGFFLVPSKYSYLWVILLTPVIAMLITSTTALLNLFQLSILSLPFNLVVLLFLYILKFRQRSYLKPETVALQQYSPEKNLYTQQNYLERFGVANKVVLNLPFYGIWKVTQAHNGEHTHQTDWRHAWDFEVVNEAGKLYEGEGNELDEYFTFNKPVLASADGLVVEVVNHIPDNEVGEYNLKGNWGNSVVIKHHEKLFSQVSHLKQGSVKVKAGDIVVQGQVIGHCGNSGRSPYPHLHFQVQETPSIGSKTLDYPLGQYLLYDNEKKKDHSKPGSGNPEAHPVRETDIREKEVPLLNVFAKPKLDQLVSNIVGEETLERAFHFVPGQTLHYEVTYQNGITEDLTWEVQTDPLNYTYLSCRKTKAKAYFRQEGKLFYFTHFEGSRKSLLFFYFLGNWKVMTGFYQGMKIEDNYPLSLLSDPGVIWLQDFVAPFFRFLHSKFQLEYVRYEDDLSDAYVELHASAKVSIGTMVRQEISFSMHTNPAGMDTFVIREKGESITLKRTPEA